MTVPISASYFKIELVSFRAKHHPSLETVAWIPSGHAASAFTAATVLQRHYGLKTGIPAYAVAAYVAASRLHDNKHYLGDVIFGAAIGIAVGRVVTQPSGVDYTFAPVAVPGGWAFMIHRTATRD